LGRLIVTLATLVVLLLGAAFVAPAFTDWNAYRSDIEQAASALLGRKISIVGDIDIALLPEPHLRAMKVAAEGSASDGAQMTAEAVDLSLSLQALLSGRVEASRLKLVHPFLIVDLSKPFNRASSPSGRGDSLSIAAGVTSLEIEGGQVSVYRDAGQPEALTLKGVDGTLFAPPAGNAYRFNGRVSQNNRPFEVKFIAAAQAGGIKLTGSASDRASKTALQVDGVLKTADGASFEGALTLTAREPLAPGNAPLEVQAKANAKVSPAGAALSDLVLTIDPENRPQTLTGSATLGFSPDRADVALKARSLDADALFGGGAKPAFDPGATAGWASVRAAADQLLWLYPDFGLHLSLTADQVQFRGELIEGAKVEGARTAQKWLFDAAEATLPGDAAVKLTGALKRTGGKSELLARAALEGKNLSRFTRWIAPPPANARAAPARAFAVGGLLTYSAEATAFSDVRGNVDGTPFTASLRFDKDPVRKLQLALAGDSFDLGGLEGGRSGSEELSAESMKAAWQSAQAQLSAIFGDDASAVDVADIDVSAGSIKTSFAEAKNVAVQAKYSRDLVTVTKLAAETPEGLALHGEGVIPLRSAGQGRFDGRIEAGSAKAILKVAALAGDDAGGWAASRAEDLAPAALAINYSTDAQARGSTAQLSGNLGAARIDGRVQLKGSLSEWRTGQFAAQLGASAMDGTKLIALLFPKAGLTAGASSSPAVLTIRASGTSERVEASGTIKAAQAQAQIDGTAEFKAQSSFSGKAVASSQTPELFLPPALLALLGGEPQANLRVETNLAYAPGRIDAVKLKAESPKNAVTGRLSIATASRMTQLSADLKGDQFSLPSILGYLLARPPSPDRLSAAMFAATASASPDIWSDRPFALSVFQETAAKIALAARTMKVGDSFALSDAQFAAKLEDGHLDVQTLTGKALGGDVSASLSLDARGATVGAAARLSVAKADLAALPINGSPALVSGKASLSLRASGQGLSPRGLLSVVQGRGMAALSDGQLAKLSPVGVQKSADDVLAVQPPLTEEAIKKRALDALQSSDFKFRHLKIPLIIRDGMLEVRRASFRNRDATVRMEAYLDLSTMLADTTWQAGVGSDKRAKWPPVKVHVAGPLRELGAKPRTLSAEDFVRAVLIRKMEGDITRLEGLNKPAAASAAPSWPAKQEPAPKAGRRKDENPTAAQAGAAAGQLSEFEKRMRDVLSKGSNSPEGQ
jgi:uncharacterized protein involved in outer membrane biogenesis